MSRIGAAVLDDMELGAGLEMAEQALRSAVGELARSFRAKGYPQASVSIEIRGKDVWVGAKSGGPRIFKGYRSLYDFEGWSGETALEAYTKAAAAIALIEDGHAYDDDFRAPLFLMSEQAEAAE